MDICKFLESQPSAIRSIEMHTAGEPTRIIISGYPTLEGATLLEKRRYASERPQIDGVRKRLMLEPRGHAGMYGAILVQETELTLSGEADIGVLFCHNEGYSTMCGHATIALGRFLVDTHDTEVFPRRQSLRLEKDSHETLTVLRLHAPCGTVKVYVPTTPQGTSDATKPVRFQSVPSFVSSPKPGITVDLSSEIAWPKLLGSRRNGNDSLSITVDIAYGGAFYALVSATELGFTTGLRGSDRDLKEIAEAARILRIVLNKNPKARESFTHPEEQDLGFLYGVTVIDTDADEKHKTWVCFFADEQIDRSPTGSCVSAHVPLAVDQGRLLMGEWCSYDSFLSVQHPGNAFRGRAIEKIENTYVVEVEGFAHYTGTSTFSYPQEQVDTMGRGFELRLSVS
ncbi:hypothetical protein GYMLUDRAFT_163351 [Collybiopsis luxurians FD-317 M1]|uniref:trans-L-3-hydroxyproline dehydratase n=1 Tax=Collybiopsis luxurians FD-317 M1 TaxID=944289 RepID=A0A0D0BGB6_9AGAR|nr:hypothetical protein GYMLUDRAFT_163351 [Collybiopsis luxurians FD-317 M1]